MEFREPTIADCDQIEAYRQAFEKNQEVIHGGVGQDLWKVRQPKTG